MLTNPNGVSLELVLVSLVFNTIILYYIILSHPILSPLSHAIGQLIAAAPHPEGSVYQCPLGLTTIIKDVQTRSVKISRRRDCVLMSDKPWNEWNRDRAR